MNQRSRNQRSNKKTQRITGGEGFYNKFFRNYSRLLGDVQSDCSKLIDTKQRWLAIAGLEFDNMGDDRLRPLVDTTNPTIIANTVTSGTDSILEIMATMRVMGVTVDKYMSLIDDLRLFYLDVRDQYQRVLTFSFTDDNIDMTVEPKSVSKLLDETTPPPTYS